LGIFVFRRRQRSESQHQVDLMRDNQTSPVRLQSGRDIPASGGITHHTGASGLEYVVEPFALPSPPSDPGAPLLATSGASAMSPGDATSASGSDPAEPSITSGRRANRQNVYVVHHDGGRAPVTVYTEGGAEVVELPPRYAPGSTSSPSERGDSDTVHEANRRREPSSVPRKARGPRPPT
jgi:hypothetical protein